MPQLCRKASKSIHSLGKTQDASTQDLRVPPSLHPHHRLPLPSLCYPHGASLFYCFVNDTGLLPASKYLLMLLLPLPRVTSLPPVWSLLLPYDLVSLACTREILRNRANATAGNSYNTSDLNCATTEIHYLEKTIIWKESCTTMFTAALFTMARTWKQPKCPSTEEWIKETWYRCTMEYSSATKKNEIMPFAATWMDLEMIILSEISQRKTDTIWYHLHVESKKNDTNALIYKTEIDS